MGRPPFSMEVRRRFWAQIAGGLSVIDAGSACGVSRAVAQRIYSKGGGVIPPARDPVPGARLTLLERDEIARLAGGRCGVREIARQIRRDPATISRELARHRSHHDGHYRASVAQQGAEENARAGGLARPAKLVTNQRLRAQVQARLVKNDSPEQIAHRLRQDFPEEPEMWVSHETIYQSIYVQGRGGLKRELAVHLRTGRALRHPRRQAQARRANPTRIKNMVGITQRPPEVADRAVPGHWEGDLITGAQNKSAIGTLVERTTGFVLLLHLPEDHGALAVQHAIVAAVAQLPELLRKTLTWDQGIEMANHAEIAAASGLDIYFCDPHSPWQRPSNENTNGLLRQYFPKSTDLSINGPGILQHVAQELNNRPRKRLDWRTPAEALDKLLCEHDNQPGVANAP